MNYTVPNDVCRGRVRHKVDKSEVQLGQNRHSLELFVSLLLSESIYGLLLSSGGLHSFPSDPLVAFVLQDRMSSEHDAFLAVSATEPLLVKV